MSETDGVRVSSIKLDAATRARLAEELGFSSGIDAIPEEIEIRAVTPEEAGVEDSEVQGFDFLRLNNNVFLNPALTPSYLPSRLVLSPNRWAIVTII
jgi:hypothetical protein